MTLTISDPMALVNEHRNKIDDFLATDLRQTRFHRHTGEDDVVVACAAPPGPGVPDTRDSPYKV